MGGPSGATFETSSARGDMGAVLVANSTRPSWNGVSILVVGNRAWPSKSSKSDDNHVNANGAKNTQKMHVCASERISAFAIDYLHRRQIASAATHIVKRTGLEGSGTTCKPFTWMSTNSSSSDAPEPATIVSSYWCDARKSVTTLKLAWSAPPKFQGMFPKYEVVITTG